jgi:hypothetical protein
MNIYANFFCLFFFGAGIEPRASGMLGKRCTTKLHLSPIYANFTGLLQNLSEHSPEKSQFVTGHNLYKNISNNCIEFVLIT